MSELKTNFSKLLKKYATMLLIICIIFASFPYMVDAEAEVDAEVDADGGYLLGDVELTRTYTDSEGKEVTKILEAVEDEAITDGDKIKMVYTWTIIDAANNINADDTTSVIIPDGFYIETSDGQEDIKDEDDDVVATYFIDATTRTLTITFNALAKTKGTPSLSVTILSEANVAEIPGEDNPVTMLFDFEENVDKEFKLKFRSKGVSKPIEVTGSLSADYDPGPEKDRIITWNARINKTYETLQNLSTVITYDEGLTLDPTSIVIYPLNIDLVTGDSSIDEGAEAISTDLYDIVINDDQTFTLTFKDKVGQEGNGLATVYDPYQINYVTTIDDVDIEDVASKNFNTRVSYGDGDNDSSNDVFATATEEDPRGSKLSKTAIKDREYNTKAITWTLLVNAAEGYIKDGVVKDVLPDGLTLYDIDKDDDDYDRPTITKVIVNDDGSTSPDGGSLVMTNSGTADVPEFELPDTHSSGTGTSRAFEIKYTTTIDTDKFDANSFTNQASLYDVAGEENVLAEVVNTSATVSINRGEALNKKTGSSNITTYDSTKYIDWTIDVNTYEMNIVNGVIYDHIGDELSYVDGTLKMYQLAVSDTGELTKGDEIAIDASAIKYEAGIYTAPDGSTRDYKMKLDLKVLEENGGINDVNDHVNYAFRLEYQTKVEDINHNVENNTKYTNDAWISYGLDLDGDGNGDTDTLDISKTGKADKKLVNQAAKNSTYTDYSSSTISWKITLKPYKSAMHDTVIEDSFTNKGLFFKEDTLVVSMKNNPDENGVSPLVLTKDVHYTVSTPIDTDLEDGITPDYHDGFLINFIDDLGGITPLEGSTYTIEYDTVYTRADHVDYTEQNSNEKKYKNKAVVTWNDESEAEPVERSLTKNATVTIADVVRDNGSKNGVLDRDNQVIDWTVNANFSAETHTNYEVDIAIVDDLTSNDYDERDGQSIKPESIEVYTYTVSADANATITQGDLIDPSEYSIINLTDDTFTIVFDKIVETDGEENGPLGQITKPYRIKYQTETVNESQANYEAFAYLGVNDRKVSAGVNYENSAVFVTKNEPNQTLNGEVLEWSVLVNTSLSTIANAKLVDTLGIGHEYRSDSIEVYKTSDLTTPVDNYTATINILDVATLEQQMVIEFTTDIEEEYIIKYETVVIAEESLEITNSAVFSGDGISVHNQGDESSVKIRVTDSFGSAQTPKRGFTVNKVDGDDNQIKLAGVEFLLLDSEKNEIGSIGTTDAEGQIIIPRFKKDLYYLREVAPLDGYQALGEDIELNLDVDEDVVINLENYLTRNLTIEKQRAGSPDIKLEGATFKVTGPVGKDSESTNTYITDENGLIELNGLEFGDYQVQEISAPSGYSLNSTVRTVTIDESSVDFTEIFTNSVKQSSSSDDDEEEVSEEEPEEEDEVVEETPEGEDDETRDSPQPKEIFKKEEPVSSPEDDILDEETEEVPEEIIYKPTVEVEEVEVKTEPEKGSVEVTDDGTIVYTPDEDFDGTDSFVVIVEIEEEEVEFEIFIDEELAEARTEGELPETGGMPLDVMVAFGSSVLASGIVLKRKRK